MSAGAKIPSAVMRLRGDGFVDVCAWCPDKLDADAWARAHGLTVSRGICKTCAPKLATEVIFDAGERCAAPDLTGSAERGTASGVPSCVVVFGRGGLRI